jgi:Ca2+-binding EF-hand superfamily protein
MPDDTEMTERLHGRPEVQLFYFPDYACWVDPLTKKCYRARAHGAKLPSQQHVQENIDELLDSTADRPVSPQQQPADEHRSRSPAAWAARKPPPEGWGATSPDQERAWVAAQAESLVIDPLCMDRDAINEAFDRFDFNGNGGLSLAEIDKAVVELLPRYNHKPSLMRAYKASDKDGNGCVTRREFRKLLHFLVYFTDLWGVFETIDLDNDHRFSPEEFRRATKLVGHSMSDSEAAEEFAAVDTDNGGLILFDEFCVWCAHRNIAEGVESDDEEAVDRSVRGAVPNMPSESRPAPVHAPAQAANAFVAASVVPAAELAGARRARRLAARREESVRRAGAAAVSRGNRWSELPPDPQNAAIAALRAEFSYLSREAALAVLGRHNGLAQAMEALVKQAGALAFTATLESAWGQTARAVAPDAAHRQAVWQAAAAATRGDANANADAADARRAHVPAALMTDYAGPTHYNERRRVAARKPPPEGPQNIAEGVESDDQEAVDRSVRGAVPNMPSESRSAYPHSARARAREYGASAQPQQLVITLTGFPSQWRESGGRSRKRRMPRRCRRRPRRSSA